MRKLSFLTVAFFLAASAHAAWDEPPKVSTGPIGSPFYRHLAYELNMDLHDLAKFEKHGFGRTETCTLILISSATHVPLKEYGKRRLKDKVSLHQFADEAHLDFEDLHNRAKELKERIEAMGEENLPPPVYPEPSPSPIPEQKPEKPKKEKMKKDAKEAPEKKPERQPDPNQTEMD